jgi:Insect cuticle protein
MLLAHVVGVTLAAPFSTRNETVKTKSFVPILKQIYEFRPDGSYSFGYESGDGSFRYETRDRQGQVQGKFGYVDTNGLLRVVEYIAGSTGYRIRWENISTPLIYNQTTDSSTQVPTTTEPQPFVLPVADDADNAISDDHLPDPVVNVDHSVPDHVQSVKC